MFSVSQRRRALLIAALAFIVAPSLASAQLRRVLPDSLSDREFWQFFTTMSEAGGSFSSENFVSNEQTYQHVIPTLQRSLTPGGVYLGVGPEQNFTYIANLEPRLAVIFDIRRQNAMAHLMYKAVFELSPTRAEFVSRLFSRPLPSVGSSVAPAALFNALSETRASDSAFDANWNAIVERLTVKHAFALPDSDLRSMKHVYAAFFEAGPEINYAYRLGGTSFGPRYVTFAQIQGLTNAEDVNMAFLADEARYQRLRTMHARNLIVPVVGDFAGPKAIRGVGAYLRDRGATVTAFYLSNVEQYLFRGFDDAERFYRNVETLPLDSTSTFIRSVPSNDGFSGSTIFGAGSVSGSGSLNAYSVQVVDSNGVRIITTVTDSAGIRTTKRSVDSSRTQSPLAIFRSLQARDDSLARARLDSTRRAAGRDSTIAPQVVTRRRDTVSFAVPRATVYGTAGGLTSGIASIRASLDAFAGGRLSTYAQAIAMTKVDGWKQR